MPNPNVYKYTPKRPLTANEKLWIETEFEVRRWTNSTLDNMYAGLSPDGPIPPTPINFARSSGWRRAEEQIEERLNKLDYREFSALVKKFKRKAKEYLQDTSDYFYEQRGYIRCYGCQSCQFTCDHLTGPYSPEFVLKNGRFDAEGKKKKNGEIA